MRFLACVYAAGFDCFALFVLARLLVLLYSFSKAIVLILAKARKNPIDSALFIRDHRNPSWIIIQYTSIYYVSISVEDMRSYDDNFVFM